MTLQETLICLTIISGVSVGVYSILTHFEEKYGKADYQAIYEWEQENDFELPYAHIEIEGVEEIPYYK